MPSRRYNGHRPPPQPSTVTARENARRRDGKFGAHRRAEADLSLVPPNLISPPERPRRTDGAVPPDIGLELVEPVECRKCGGDGSFTYRSGAPGVCAPCNGEGLVEGNAAARKARRARHEFTVEVYRDIFRSSPEAANALNDLREHAPERYERALTSWAAGRDDLVPALQRHWRQMIYDANPKERLRDLAKHWPAPPGLLDGLDTTEGAFDQCKDVSAAYTAYINSLDEPHLKAEWVQVVGMNHERPNADPRWLNVPREQWQHYVTRVTITNPSDPEAEPEHLYVDWTLRQFDPQAAYPWLGSPRLVEAFFTETYDIPDRAVQWQLKNPVYPERLKNLRT